MWSVIHVMCAECDVALYLYNYKDFRARFSITTSTTTTGLRYTGNEYSAMYSA